LCRIGPYNRREHVLAKLRNPEPTIAAMESHTCDNQKTEKDSIFKQGHSMTLAAASVISHIYYMNN
jgi:hypothetical protein